MPDIREEIPEIARQTWELGLTRRRMIQAVHEARLEPLDDETWDHMENTHSNDLGLTWHEIKRWEGKDWRGIVRAIREGGTLPAPMVVIHEGRPYCMAGNTRLSVSRMLGVRPEVLMVRV